MARPRSRPCGGNSGLLDFGEMSIPQNRIRQGGKAVRLGYDSGNACNDDFLGPNFVLAHRLVVPADATELTLSLWSTRVGDPGVDLWSRHGRMLYQNHSAIGKGPQGILEVDMMSDSPTPELLVPDTGQQLQVSSRHDRNPVSAPDGRHFITYRNVDGAHWKGSMDFAQGLRSHLAIDLHDRLDPSHPRQLLLADHGDSIGWLDFSPDGNYVLYTLLHENDSDLWWLEVATGATGPLTTDGASYAAKWRRGDSPQPLPMSASRWAISRPEHQTLRFTLNADPGDYIIQSSQDLRTWTDLFPLTAGPFGQGSVEDTSSLETERLRFFRVRDAP